MPSQSANSPASQCLGFKRLPAELRDLVWEFTLPDRRLFHVKRISKQKPSQDPTTREMCFRFHIQHTHPVTLHVCNESRAVALRNGFFLSPNGDHPGYWFNPELDILYFDRNQRTSFHVRPNQPRITVPGWDRVLNVGLEWRAFFRDTPRPSQDETTASYWRAAIDPMYSYMPRMRTLNYILPMVRHKGGIIWGREPFGVEQFEAELVSLPEGTQIPWETMRNRGNGRGLLMTDLRAVNGLVSPMVTWYEVKADIEKGFEEDSEAQPVQEGSGSGDGEAGEFKQPDDKMDHAPRHNPQIVGWWLLRAGAPTTHPNPQVMEFRH